jgi:hypothetical protein
MIRDGFYHVTVAMPDRIQRGNHGVMVVRNDIRLRSQGARL